VNGWSSDHTRAIELASKSIEAFGRIFMPKALYADTPDFHRAIYRDLQDDNVRKLGIIAPRGHSKSTVTSVLFPMWKTIFKPQGDDLFGILISESHDQASNFLGLLKHNLASNPNIVGTFGSLEGKKWTEDEIRTSNGCRWVAKGTGQKVRGMLTGEETITRPNLIILDDFESETNSGTKEAIDKNVKWITKAVEPSLSDDGRLIAIGTIVSQRAYLSRIRKDPAFKVHFYQAIMGGEPLWPERFSMKKLMALKASFEARGELEAFYQEYMNIPINVEDQTFRPEMLRRYSGELVVVDGRQPCLRFDKEHPAKPDWWRPGQFVPVTVGVGVDLAISEDHRADWTVIMPVAMDKDGNRYVLPFRRFKTRDIDVIVDTVLEVARANAASYVHFETVQFQQAVAQQFRKAMYESETYFGVHETHPRSSKDSRIRSLQPIYARGRVYHMEGLASELEAEMLNYPGGRHDDCLDALWLASQYLTEPQLEAFDGERLPAIRYNEELSWTVL
jgi:predicted phage terminase large subunit-like protein